MIRFFTLFIFAAFSPFSGFAQDFVQLSVGEGYTQQVFYDLDDGTSVVVANDAWDLAFTTLGLQDAGIHINEASSGTFTEPKPGLEVYRATASSFNALTEFDDNFPRLYNDEASWLYGAFNSDRETSDPFNYGWGQYNGQLRRVVGDQLFVIKLRSGKFIKFKIESLDLTTYNIRYADLDGSNEQTFSFDKNDSDGSLAFFSFETGDLVDLDVEGFDLLYTRYNSPAEHPDEAVFDTLNYNVTGVLSGIGTQVVEIENKPPSEVTEADAISFSTRLDAIGYDWKVFDFDGGYSIPENLSYIVRSNEGKLYHLIFIDFEGITTGVTTIQVDAVRPVSTEQLTAADLNVKVFGMPIQHNLALQLDWQKKAIQARFQLLNAVGQTVWQQTAMLQAGENRFDFDVPTLASATYFLRIQTDNAFFVETVSIMQQ